VKFAIIEKYKNKIGLYFNSPLRKGLRQDFIFIHINKTGGTSIIDITGKPFRKHMTSKEVIAAIGPGKWNAAYKFAVVRNPWDKMLSHYKHNIKTKPKTMRLEAPNTTEIIPFNDWLQCTLGVVKNKKYYNRPQHFLPQVEWLKDLNGQILFDKIIRFESLASDYAQVAEQLGLKSDLPHLNSTERTAYREFYSPESRKLVEDWFKEDIELFGYRFEKEALDLPAT
jgi:hypothetical protein